MVRFSKFYSGKNFTKFSVLWHDQQFYLLALVVTFALLYLLQAYLFTSFEPLKSNRLLPSDILLFLAPFWATIILWSYRRQHRVYNHSLTVTLLACSFLSWLVVRTITTKWLDVDFLIISPFLAVIGLGLLAFGFQGMRTHWQTLLLLCLMVVPPNAPQLDSWLHISQLTTAISAFLLHYLGLKATYSNTLLTLLTGQVKVAYQCTGGPLSVILLKVCLLIAISFPLTWGLRLGLCLSAIGTGFGLGCMRVALLAFVVNNNSLFHYWHGPKGSQIFLTLGIVVFVFLCSWLVPTEEDHPLEQEASQKNDDVKTKTWGRIPLLLTAWVGLISAAIYLVIVPTPGKQFLATANKLDSFPIVGWQLTTAKSLSNPTIKNLNPGFEGMLTGKEYKYLFNGRNLEIQTYYVVNTGSNMDAWLQQLTGISIKDIEKNMTARDGLGYYALTTDGLQANLTACINPRGGSTVSSSQFTHNRYSYDFTWNRILSWMLGTEVLQDERCMWVKLSTPLNGGTPSVAYQILESVWAANYTTWQSHFPRI
ncbi:MAG: hypothetical protein NVSMB70_06820 [Chamaesiphon sp.]